MRMRKKKNLSERLSACEEYIIDTPVSERDYNKAIVEKSCIDVEALFKNNNPLQLEIGCGKGQFICETAKRNPDINYIAVEKTKNVIVQAAEKIKAEGIDNVRFMALGAEYLLKFIPEKSVERIYLNFSCPYPKEKYRKHRLTHGFFLDIYKSLLKNRGEIYQKTDNMHFFEFSIEELSAKGYKIKNVSLDLHKSNFEGNIVTEYEKRFSDMGFPIYRLEAEIPEEG